MVAATIVLARVKGFRVAAATAIVLSSALLPMSVLFRSSTPHVGEAAGVPVIYDYSIFLFMAAAALAMVGVRRLKALKLWLPLVGWLVLSRLLWWSGTPEQTAGLLLLSQGILAFGLGSALGPWRDGDDPHPSILVGTCVLQVGAVALGAVGVLHLHPSGPQSADLAGRAFGTLGHPDQLAKTLAIGLAAILPVVATGRRRRMVVLGVLATLGGIALSQGRAAFGGAIAMLLVWVLLQPRAGGLRRRASVLLVLLVIVVAVSAGTFQERFAQDPAGGSRGHLTAVAVEAIRARPITGTGPNAYVTTVGRTDELTATGVPVHNVFLLSAAELGIPGAALLLFPFVAMWVAAWRRRAETGRPGAYARACLGLLPLSIVIGWTGWGLLETSVFVFFCYIGGYFWGNITSDIETLDSSRVEGAISV